MKKKLIIANIFLVLVLVWVFFKILKPIFWPDAKDLLDVDGYFDVTSMDYVCNPLAGNELVVENSTRHRGTQPSFPVTNGQGVVAVAKTWSIIFGEKEKYIYFHSSDRNSLIHREISRGPTQEDLYEYKTATAQNSKPFVIYPYSSYVNGEYRDFNKLQELHHLKGNKAEYLLKAVNLNISKIEFDWKNNFLEATLYSPPGVSFVLVEDINVFSLAYIDDQKWKGELNTSFTDIDYPKESKRFFYFRVDKKEDVVGRLTMSVSKRENTIYANYFMDMVTKEKLEFPEYLPHEKCGGNADRYFTGYYGSIDFAYLDTKYSQDPYLKVGIILEQKAQQASEAAMLDKPNEWYVSLVREARKKENRNRHIVPGLPPEVVDSALDNNSNISSRIETIYTLLKENSNEYILDWYTKQFCRIASNPSAPDSVLLDIFSTFNSRKSEAQIYQCLLRNSKLSNELADKLASALLTDKYLYNSQLTGLIIRSVFENKQVSGGLLNNFVKENPRLAESYPLIISDERIGEESLRLAYYTQFELVKYPKNINSYLENKNFPKDILVENLERELSKKIRGDDDNDSLVKLLNMLGEEKYLYHNGKLLPLGVVAKTKLMPEALMLEIIHEEEGTEYWYKRSMLAKSPSVTDNTIEVLSKDERVLGELLENEYLSSNQLQKLVNKLDLSEKPNYCCDNIILNSASAASLIKFVYDNGYYDPKKVYYFTLNPNTPPEILQLIFHKVAGKFKNKIAAHQNMTLELATFILDEGKFSNSLPSLANNPLTPEKILMRLYQKDYVVVDSYSHSSELPVQRGLYCNSSFPESAKRNLPDFSSVNCESYFD